MGGAVDLFRAAVRAAIGLPEDPGEPPDLMRLGLYRARVDSCLQDGSAMDVTPEDDRIPAAKNVPVRVGAAGFVQVVAPGAVVLLGWERGDPTRPYCAPFWESGATVQKLVVKAQMVYLGDESGAKALLTVTEHNAHIHGTPAGNSTAPTVTAVGTTRLKAL
jgi:hypothetical protein